MPSEDWKSGVIGGGVAPSTPGSWARPPERSMVRERSQPGARAKPAREKRARVRPSAFSRWPSLWRWLAETSQSNRPLRPSWKRVKALVSKLP